jgi:RNA polymerase-binding transcription factor DksA
MAIMTSRQAGDGYGKYDTLETLLLKQDALLRARRHVLREGAAATMTDVKDPEEHAVDAGEAAIGLAVLGLNSQTVQAIEMALGRMTAGTYGTCVECGRGIAPSRLQALSFADRCRDCQQGRERGARAIPPSPHAVRRPS